jgi:transketolase
MEGEAKEAFAAIPGLAAKGRVNPFVMVISDNDTKLSGRITKDSFCDDAVLRAPRTISAGTCIACRTATTSRKSIWRWKRRVADAKANPTKPVCLWLKTIKGYGVKSTMENAAGGHGFPLANGEKIVEFVDEICFGNPQDEFKPVGARVSARTGK